MKKGGNNDLQNIQNAKDLATRIPLKTGDEPGAPEGWGFPAQYVTPVVLLELSLTVPQLGTKLIIFGLAQSYCICFFRKDSSLHTNRWGKRQATLRYEIFRMQIFQHYLHTQLIMTVLIILRYSCIIHIYLYILYWLKKIIITTYQI